MLRSDEIGSSGSSSRSASSRFVEGSDQEYDFLSAAPGDGVATKKGAPSTGAPLEYSRPLGRQLLSFISLTRMKPSSRGFHSSFGLIAKKKSGWPIGTV